MAGFRLDSIAALSRQLAFTPPATRIAQLAAAETLLLELHPGKAYPLDFVIYRITGYHPRDVGEDLLTGIALRHDLGLLIERVSEGLDLRTEQSPHPVLSIEQVAQKLDVTSKTIQRWRRKGLAARRFIFPDGKRRVGFFAHAVEQFIAAHRDSGLGDVNFSAVEPTEQDRLLQWTARLARRCHTTGGTLTRDAIARRAGRRFNRSALTVLALVEQHDQCDPQHAIFAHAAPDLTDAQRQSAARAYRRGQRIAEIARTHSASSHTMYRAILEDRLKRHIRRHVRFIDDPLFHQEDAAGVIAAIVAQRDTLDASESGRAAERMARDLPPELRGICREAPPGDARLRALLLEMNFHKYRFVHRRRQIDPEQARWRDVLALDADRRRIMAARNQILRGNLRLVVSVARRHLRAGLSLMELISEGSLTLMRAIDGFDLGKGNKFSTYATLALMKGFARSAPAMAAGNAEHRGFGGELLETISDGQRDLSERAAQREQVDSLLRRLTPREQDVLRAQFGLQGGRALNTLNLTDDRILRVQRGALNKLRAAARNTESLS